MRYPDKRPEWEKKREHDVIRAVNGLKIACHTPSGTFSIDPDEIREQVIVSREQLKHLVQKPPATPSHLSLRCTSKPQRGYGCVLQGRLNTRVV